MEKKTYITPTTGWESLSKTQTICTSGFGVYDDEAEFAGVKEERGSDESTAKDDFWSTEWE